jgi:hypothetical protein
MSGGSPMIPADRVDLLGVDRWVIERDAPRGVRSSMAAAKPPPT